MTDTKKASLSDTATPIDIASLDTAAASDKGAEIELLHPTTNAPLGIFITVLGKDSQVFRDHVKHDVNAQLRKEALAQRRGKKLDPLTAEEAEEKAIELLVLCTLGWRSETKNAKGVVLDNQPHILMGGEVLTFNVLNAKRIYTDSLWIRRQVDDAIGDLENFIKS